MEYTNDIAECGGPMLLSYLEKVKTGDHGEERVTLIRAKGQVLVRRMDKGSIDVRMDVSVVMHSLRNSIFKRLSPLLA